VYTFVILAGRLLGDSVSQAHMPHLPLIHQVMQNDKISEKLLRRSID
jgi:hypothetical protein